MYYRARQMVLQNLKDAFVDETGFTEDSFMDSIYLHGTDGQYCLRHLQDNLIHKISPVHAEQFASGKSVLGNMHYLASSYALTFNLFGNHSILMPENEIGILPDNYDIVYKRILRALKTKNAFVNIDACLFGRETQSCICFEVKMLEWFIFKINPIKDTFLETDHYYYADTAPVFQQSFQFLIPFLNRDGWEHYGCFQNCDGFLLLRQLLAMYNSIRNVRENPLHENAERLRNVKDLVMVTVYWMPSDPSVYGMYQERIIRAEIQMHQEMCFFMEIAAPLADLFWNMLGIRLRFLCLNCRELLNVMNMPIWEKEKLKRYLI